MGGTQSERETMVGRGFGHWRRFGLIVLLLLVASLRLTGLGADPPVWLAAFVTDEGWWADGARGQVMFNDYFSDDLGVSYLAAPAYTWALKVIYSIGGVGLVQTRSLSAVCALATIVLTVLIALRWAGWGAAMLAAFMMMLSPLLFGNGRVALLEPMQTLFVMGAFGAAFAGARSRAASVLAGLCVAVAIAVKPTALFNCLAPLICAVLAHELWLSAASEIARPWYRRVGLGRLAWVCAGLGAGMAILFLTVIAPNWKVYWAMLAAEGGIGKGDWVQMYLAGPLEAFISFKRGVAVHWQPAQYSPLILAAFWLYLLTIFPRLGKGLLDALRRFTPFEVYGVVWSLTALMILLLRTAYWNHDRYYYPLLPVLAILGGMALARLYGVGLEGAEALPRSGWIASFLLWLVLLLPVVIFLKPYAILLIEHYGKNILLGDKHGINTGLAAGIFMLGCLLLLLILTPARGLGMRLAACRTTAWAGLVFLGLLVIYEGWIVGGYFAGIQYKILRQQRELAALVKDGETVLGDGATIMFLPQRVRTVRRTHPNDFSGPPPNFDVWERLKPNYILETRCVNFLPYPSFYGDLIEKGYKSVRRIDIGPMRQGLPHYEFELYERKVAGVATPGATATGLTLDRHAEAVPASGGASPRRKPTEEKIPG